MKTKDIIISVLEDYKDWTPSWKLIKTDTPYGWLGTSADREARRLAELGILERERKGLYTYYRLKQVGQQTLI